MRRVTLILIVLAIVLVVVAVTARFGRGEQGSTSPVATTPPNDPSGRPGGSALSPANGPFPDDGEAARAAAIDAVGMTGEIVAAGAFTRRDLVAAISSRRFGPKLADLTSHAVESMLLELGDAKLDVAQLRVIERPVSSHIDRVLSASSVRVSVWSVLVVALPGTGPGRSTWRTITLDMVLEKGRWLIDGWSVLPGPSPMPPAEGVFDDASLVATRLGWDPVVGNATELAGA